MSDQANSTAQNVKIFWFEKRHTERAERELEGLLKQGWEIMTAGGTGGGGGSWGGFIVLVRR